MADGIRWDWDRDNVVPDGWQEDYHNLTILLLLD
jgi:hypothetical protein